MVFYEENRENYQIVPGIRLSEPQIDGIDFILHRFNCILNLKPGLGKTLAGIVSTYQIMKKTNDTVTFILCPKAANTAWKKELKLMNLKYSIITTEEKYIDNSCRYFLFNYSNIEDMVKLLRSLKERNFRVIGLFDEIHVLGSSTSNLVKSMKSVRTLFTCVCGLTGTPLLNDIEGLYNVVNYVVPNYFGTWWDFKNNWVVTKKKTIRVNGRSRQIDEIVGYRDLNMLRHKLNEVIITRGKDYPLVYLYRDCSLTEDEKLYYENAAKGILDGGEEKAMAARLWDLQKIADGTSLYMEGEKLYSKKKLLINTLKEIMSREEGVLIYTEMEDTYTSLGDLIKSYKGYLGYRNLWFITGKTPYKKRVECEKSLKPKDIVIVTKAGSTSINLQAVNNVIFYNLPFALGSYIQMVGRVARTDSIYEKQNIYMLEVRDTIDTYKRMLLQSNMTLVQEIFGKDAVMPYFGDIENDVMKKYRQYFKNKLLWVRY